MTGSKRSFRPRPAVITAAIIASFGSAAWAAPGDPLGPTQAITGSGLSFTSIARGAGGETVVVFSGANLMARRLAADGTPQGADIVVGPIDYGPQPDVAVNAHGDFVVAWRHTGSDGASSVYAQRYQADGSAVGSTVAVSEPLQPAIGEAVGGGASVAMDDDGDFVVAWSQGRELHTGAQFACNYGIGICTQFGAYSVRTRRYSSGGTVAEPIRTLASDGNLALQVLLVPGAAGSELRAPQVAMAADGSYAVAWERYSYVNLLSPLAGVYAQRFGAGGLPGLTRVVSLQSDNQASPAIAMDSNGGFVVAYKRDSRALRDYTGGIYARLYPANGGLGGFEFRVDNAFTSNPDQPSVAMDAAGDFVVAWNTGHSSPGSVHAQRYAAGGGPLGINFSVDSDSSGDAALLPAVASDAAGNFAVIWTAYFDGVRARFFEGP